MFQDIYGLINKTKAESNQNRCSKQMILSVTPLATEMGRINPLMALHKSKSPFLLIQDETIYYKHNMMMGMETRTTGRFLSSFPQQHCILVLFQEIQQNLKSMSVSNKLSWPFIQTLTFFCNISRIWTPMNTTLLKNSKLNLQYQDTAQN